MALSKLIDGIYVDTDGTNGGNYGAIVLEDEIVMIDSGMIHHMSREMKTNLEHEIGLPILKLVFTHSHGDHVFGAQAFEPVSLIASAPMRSRCEDNLRSVWKQDTLLNRYSETKRERPELWEAIQSLSIRLPDIVFKDQISLGNNREITVKLLGGHTSGSSIVISHPQKAIFVGDLIFSGQFPYGGDPTCDPDRWIMALEEVQAIDYETIIPGHGPVCGRSELEDYTQALKDLRAVVKDVITSGISKDEIIERDMIPLQLRIGVERFADVTLDHWFNFYK
ncbi:MAG: MBL fold metallo-hydrolase [Candidatus Thorarchaeota archaeon]|jgi:glyoxylase-like metal-dependent hydrolase (beta-lactamase superfamily II)